jgi:hypothetical protein
VVVLPGGFGAVGADPLRGEHSFSDAPAARPARATATLDIRSQPAGAHVFVDGTPTGLRTPTVLTGLVAGSRVQVRLDKPGYEPVTEQVTLVDGQARAISLTLKEAPAAPQEGSNQ